MVLLGGCDKTTPGQLMGAASVDLPTIVVSSGPMLNGKFRGCDIGSGTDVWKFSEDVRAGKMSLDDFMAAESGMSRTPGTCMTMGTADRLTSEVPLLVDLQPSGRYLMEDLHYAGGLPAVMMELSAVLHTSASTVSGLTVGESLATAECFNREVIRTLADPVNPIAGIWVMHGNLCPNGAVMPSAASAELFQHRGRAVVFESIEDLRLRIDDPKLEVDAGSVLVLKGCGPKGYPGLPEVGNMPLPRKLLAQGVRDMLRISDARMSGTAFGTVVLHIAPEAEAGGPLAMVRNGDEILFDGINRRLELLISPQELAARGEAWQRTRPPPKYHRGYYQLYVQHATQADRGCDLDFLIGGSGSTVERESH